MANYNGHFEDSSGNILLNTPHSMANIEGSTASQVYVIGEHLIYNNRLCEVIANIASGTTLAIGTNIQYTDLATINKRLTASNGTHFTLQNLIDGAYS